MLPDQKEPARSLEDYPEQHAGDFLEDISCCQRILLDLGLELLILDQTRLDVGMLVVKVIVPGLRHFWDRFAPGRLYQVPMKMNWMDQPKNEEDLNPISMFF